MKIVVKVVRDRDGKITILTKNSNPKKVEEKGFWNYKGCSLIHIEYRHLKFKHIKWEDVSPKQIIINL